MGGAAVVVLESGAGAVAVVSAGFVQLVRRNAAQACGIEPAAAVVHTGTTAAQRVYIGLAVLLSVGQDELGDGMQVCVRWRDTWTRHPQGKPRMIVQRG